MYCKKLEVKPNFNMRTFNITVYVNTQITTSSNYVTQRSHDNQL